MLCNSLIYHQRAIASVHYNSELRIEAGCLKLDASETTIYSNDTKLQKRFYSVSVKGEGWLTQYR